MAKAVNENQWAKIVLKPKTIFVQVVSSDKKHIHCDIYNEDDPIRDDIKMSDIEKIIKLNMPKTFVLDGAVLCVFDDGTIMFEGRVIPNDECLKIFKTLGKSLGYDIQG